MQSAPLDNTAVSAAFTLEASHQVAVQKFVSKTSTNNTGRSKGSMGPAVRAHRQRSVAHTIQVPTASMRQEQGMADSASNMRRREVYFLG